MTMNLLSPGEVMETYIGIGAKKAVMPVPKMLLLGIAAGSILGMAGTAAGAASYALANPSLARLVSGLIFPFGLGLVMVLGMELMTGNCMMPISVLSGRAAWGGMLRNWLVVYIGNYLGATLAAAAFVFAGPMDYGEDGLLAVHTLQTAADKCALPFGKALALGILCNVLVCMGVLCALSAKDTAGRFLGAYIPVSLFVIGGFEHSVANMFYIQSGLFARLVPRCEELAAAAGLDLSSLSWPRFWLGNLLPVTLGNLLGGAGLALVLWYCHITPPAKDGRSKG